MIFHLKPLFINWRILEYLRNIFETAAEERHFCNMHKNVEFEYEIKSNENLLVWICRTQAYKLLKSMISLTCFYNFIFTFSK